MSSTVQRSSRSGGGGRQQSLFFRDIASPISAHRGKFVTPGQAAAVSALWKENFTGSDLPPPPVFTLEDRADFSPEPGLVGEMSASPEFRSEARTPLSPGLASASPLHKAETPSGSSGVAVTGGMLVVHQQQQQAPGSSSWWSPVKSGGVEHDEKGKGSPVDGVVQPGALVMLPPPREVARPEMQRNSLLTAGNLNEEEWVTVYGFSPGDTNLVLREFEKCGVILKHILGPRDANWMHILYQNRYDAQKALGKNGMQINSVLIVGVKPVDPVDRQYLNEKLNSNSRGGFMVSLPPPSANGRSTAPISSLKTSPRPYYLQSTTTSISDTGRRSDGAIATPSKSVFSKAMDLMFGL